MRMDAIKCKAYKEQGNLAASMNIMNQDKKDNGDGNSRETQSASDENLTN